MAAILRDWSVVATDYVIREVLEEFALIAYKQKPRYYFGETLCYLQGTIFNDSRFQNGKIIGTSCVQSIFKCGNSLIATTQTGSKYILPIDSIQAGLSEALPRLLD